MSNYDDASLIYYPSGYKASKAYSLKPTDGSGDLTFTRASTATRVNESGLIEEVATGVPRIDYTGGGCGKLLLEPQRTNLALRSEEFDNADWAKNNSTISANATTSPDGTTNADKIIPSTTGTNFIFQSLAGSGTQTNSFFVKAGGKNFCWLLNAAGSVSSYFNLANGTVAVNASGTAKIESFGNGWYRISETTTSVSGNYLGIGPSDVAGNGTSTVNGTDGIFVFGGQNESGAYATSYIPTNTTAVTRVVDSASKSGISSLIGQTEGTILFEIPQLIAQPLGTYGAILSVYTSSSDRIGFICVNSTQISIYIIAGGAAQLDFTFTPSNGVNKIALGYANNDAVVVVNGTILTTDTSIVVPPSSAIALNDYGFVALSANTSINQVQLFTTRLSNAELETLTTL